MDIRRLDGKNALITGGGTGIGGAIALRFAEEGANVAINYHKSLEEAEETEEELAKASEQLHGHGVKHMLLQADVSSEADVIGMFGQVLKEWGRLDILVNNSGIQKFAPSDQVSARDYDLILGVNLRGAFLCSREAIKHFLSRPGGGVIVNNSSVHEIIPRPGYVTYAISKGGMEQMTRTLALEYADRGIRVNAIGPGAIITPINKNWVYDEKARAAVEAHIPMGRVGKPEEIAAAVAFLASDDASYVTGQTLFACGGLTLFPEFREAWSGGH